MPCFDAEVGPPAASGYSGFAMFDAEVGPRLLLDTEAPVMMPSGVYFSSFATLDAGVDCVSNPPQVVQSDGV